MIDHRDSPGLTDEEIRQSGSPIPLGMGRAKVELPVLSCSHCQAMLVFNPMRTRERGHCPKCDRYVCDTCKAVLVATGICRPFAKVMDETLEAAAKAQNIGEI